MRRKKFRALLQIIVAAVGKPCFVHIPNLVVDCVIKTESSLRITNNVRDVVLFFKGSLMKSDLLRSKQQVDENKNKLILNVKTRWNSVYYMLERYVMLSSVVHQIFLDNPKVSTAVELNTIKKLINFNTESMSVLSREQYVTVSIIIPLINVLKTNVNDEEEEDDIII